MELKTLASAVLDRTIEITHSNLTSYLRNREQVVADELNRLTVENGYVAACMSAVLRLTELCYVRSGSRLVNVDPATWRVGINVPWSDVGYAKYSLRRWEGEILRKIMLARGNSRRVPPLFDLGQRRWHINLQNYPTMEAAVAYWNGKPLTVEEWLLHADAMRTAARTRMQALRQRG